MTSAIFVLIMWAHNSGATAQEFESKAACVHALDVIGKAAGKWQYFRAVCVPKGDQNETAQTR